MNDILWKMCWSYFDFHLMITWRSNHYLFNSDYHTSNICVPFVHYPCHKITAWWSLVNHLLIIQRLSYLYINEDYQLIIWFSLEDLMILLWLCEDHLITTWRLSDIHIKMFCRFFDTYLMMINKSSKKLVRFFYVLRWSYDIYQMIIWWLSDDHMMIYIWGSDYLQMSFWWSYYNRLNIKLLFSDGIF